jgi:DNA-binding HxlR family transcriptional regulator
VQVTTETTPTTPVTMERAQRDLVDQVLDKWSLCVITELCARPMRFNELRRSIPPLTQKSLTATLRRLERNGMVERIVLDTRPVAVEYRLAPLASTLRELVDALVAWTAKVLPEVREAQERYDDA